MTKDVLITISGMQMADGDCDDVELIIAGDYYQKNDGHYIVYDEVLEDFPGVIKNMIKVRPDSLDIRKSGSVNAHMSFQKDKKNLSCYATPMGELMIGIHTNEVTIDETPDNLRVCVDYSLNINYEHVSECNIIVDIKSRSTAQLRLS